MTGTAEWIGECAWNALIEEVNTTPKPGLVDLYSNGAHTDMDAETFRRSAEAGRCLKEQRELTALGLLEMEQEMTVRVLTAELEKLRGKISAAGQATHGERNLHRYGTAGCRGEAIEGYPGVFGIALPVLRADLLAAAIFILELTEGCQLGGDSC